MILLKLGVIITFSLVSPADAKDNGFLLGADAWSNRPPISRPLRRNYGLFDSKTTSSSGAPKKDPNGSSTPQNPAMKKDSQSTPTFYQHLSQTSNKRIKNVL